MKSILFSICLVALASTTVMAQTATTKSADNTATQVDARATFASKLSEFEAAASRNKLDLVQSIYMELAAQMSKQMTQVHQDYTTAAEPKKEALKKKLDLLQGLYADTKMLSVDLAKNNKDMAAKMKQFQQNF